MNLKDSPEGEGFTPIVVTIKEWEDNALSILCFSDVKGAYSVGFSVFPDFPADGGDEPQIAGLVGEQGGDADSSFDFIVDGFEYVDIPQPVAMIER